MASRCNRLMNKASISSIKSALKSNLRTPPSASTAGRSANTSSSPNFPLPTRSTASPLRRFSLSRSPSELGGVQSLLPLHNAVAAARLTSCLSTSSRSCRSLSQGPPLETNFAICGEPEINKYV